MNTLSTGGIARTTPLSTQLQLQRHLTTAQQSLAALQRQISTGQKFHRPGESPIAARRTILLQRLIESNSTHGKNLQSADRFLGLTDSKLIDFSQTMTDLKGALLEVPQSTFGSEQRLTVKTQLESAINQLVGVANTRLQGRYLFAGGSTHIAPYSFQNGFVKFDGNFNDLNTIPGFDALLQSNIHAGEVFGGSQPTISGSVDLNPGISLSTKLSELNGGNGVQLGPIAISDSENQVVIDLSNAATVGDVVRLIEDNAPEGRTVDVELVDDHFEISIDSATPSLLLIEEVDGGQTAHDLGIYTNLGSASSTIVGFDLNPSVTKTTLVAALNFVDDFGAPIAFDQDSGFLITQGNDTFTVDLSDAESIEDILNAIEHSGAAVKATISESGQGIEIFSTIAGVDFTIGENGGTTASQLGIRSFNLDTRLDHLNFGKGVTDSDGIDFTIHTNSGTQFDIDIAGAETIGDLIDIINQHPDNQNPATQIIARLASHGNGLELFDANAPGAEQLAVSRSVLTSAAVELGLIPEGETRSVPSSDPNIFTGNDVNPRELNNVFTTLQRLVDAIGKELDEGEFNRAMNLFEADVARLNSAIADVSARESRIEALIQSNEDEQLHLQTFLSEEFDTDLVEAISSLTTHEAALETSLQLMARTFQLNLFDFI